jgi:phosphoenolpyruvate carboxykinase (GTP)
MTPEPPAHLVDWRGEDWTPASGRPAAHPNARFTVAAGRSPSIAPEWEDPAGVPIDAFLFGGRRASVVPLVREAFDWEHAVFLGATMSSEQTAAAFGNVGELRFDPFAMLPFCGYNMADYFGHWLQIGRREGAVLPRVFLVNWFRKDAGGRFIWPGFGHNARVLEWIFRRCDGAAEAVESPIGLLPAAGELRVDGLDLGPEKVAALLTVDEEALRAELPQIAEHLARFGDDLPAEVREQFDQLRRGWVVARARRRAARSAPPGDRPSGRRRRSSSRSPRPAGRASGRSAAPARRGGRRPGPPRAGLPGAWRRPGARSAGRRRAAWP